MTEPARRLYDIALEPEIGTRFQPTGFPDIGAATFRRPVVKKIDGQEVVETVECLLVESPQSMANHLEGATWDEGADTPVETVKGLPYVRVERPEGSFVTSSRTEAHRLASAFIKDSTLEGTMMTDVIRDRLGLAKDTPLDHRRIAAAVARLDPCCLLHGVFFAESSATWPGQPKIARAVTGFVEASHVEPVVSGGVKRDHVAHDADDAGSEEGYGSIPFHRMEYTAAYITGSFSIDLAQLRSYGLSEPATRALELLAQWEIRTVVDNALRLRTACALAVADGSIVDRKSGEPLPSLEELDRDLRGAVERAGDAFGPGEAIRVVWESKRKKDDRKKAAG